MCPEEPVPQVAAWAASTTPLLDGGTVAVSAAVSSDDETTQILEVELTIGGAVVPAKKPASPPEVWTATVAAGLLAPGANTVLVQATDDCGRVGEATVPIERCSPLVPPVPSSAAHAVWRADDGDPVQAGLVVGISVDPRYSRAMVAVSGGAGGPAGTLANGSGLVEVPRDFLLRAGPADATGRTLDVLVVDACGQRERLATTLVVDICLEGDLDPECAPN